MGGTTVSLHSSVTTPRTYGLRCPVYMCSPLHAIPNPLVWWKYSMCNNNPASPSHPRLLLLLSRQSSSFNACNRGAPAHNQPILWVPLVGRSTASLYTIWSRCKYTIAADTQQIRDHTHTQRPMLNMTTDRCGAAEKSTQYQWMDVALQNINGVE